MVGGLEFVDVVLRKWEADMLAGVETFSGRKRHVPLGGERSWRIVIRVIPGVNNLRKHQHLDEALSCFTE